MRTAPPTAPPVEVRHPARPARHVAPARRPLHPGVLPHARTPEVSSAPQPSHRPSRVVPRILVPEASPTAASTRLLLFAPAVVGALLLLLVATPLILVPGALQFQFGRARSPLLAVGLSLLGGEAVLLLLFHPLAG